MPPSQGIQAVEWDIFSIPSLPPSILLKLSTSLSAHYLLIKSGWDHSYVWPKKVRYENFSSFTDSLGQSQLNSLSIEEITSELHAALDFAKTQTIHITKLEAELVDVKLSLHLLILTFQLHLRTPKS